MRPISSRKHSVTSQKTFFLPLSAGVLFYWSIVIDLYQLKVYGFLHCHTSWREEVIQRYCSSKENFLATKLSYWHQVNKCFCNNLLFLTSSFRQPSYTQIRRIPPDQGETSFSNQGESSWSGGIHIFQPLIWHSKF